MRPYLITFLILLVYLFVSFTNEFLGFSELYQDENHYWPTALLFSKEFIPSLEVLRTYNQLNTPLPFMMGGWVLQIFGESIQHLRWMNFVLSFGILLVFIWYKPVARHRLWWSLFFLLAMPSFYLCAIHYYTDMVAWAAVLIGVVCYLKGKHWGALIAFAAAIASRQYMLAFPVGIGLFEGIRIWKSVNWDMRRLFAGLWADRVWVFYLVAVLTLVPWMILWGGLAPSAIMNAQHYGDAPFYNIGFVIYVSACAACYYVIPEALILGKRSEFFSYPKKYPLKFGIIVAFVVVLLFSFPPRQTFNEYFTWPYLGYLDQFLETIKISGLVKNAIYGVLMVITLIRFIPSGSISLGAILVLVNILLLGKAQLSWDKYFFPTLMILWFLTLHGEERVISTQKDSAKQSA